MMHPHTEIRPVDDVVGLGVFATKLIPRGTMTWVRDSFDTLIPDAAVQRLDPLRRRVVDRYAWQEGGNWILCWDHARYVNHSCEANCIGIGVQFEVALRDIQPGEQLTDDYRSLGPFEDAFRCCCGAPTCAKRVHPEVPEALVERWKAAFALAMQDYDRVAQPLEPLMIRPNGAAPTPERPVANRLRL